MTDMAQMGCVVRIGVDVNNAIVLVDMVNRFRAEGLDPRRLSSNPLLADSDDDVHHRVRVHPDSLQFGQLDGDGNRAPGMTMMGGLVSSTFRLL